MNHNQLTVIKGGSTSIIDSYDHKFVSAYTTDTRLMGVVGVYIHWILESPAFYSDFHQFFYFDAEEFGLETYREYMGSETLSISLIEKSLFNNLGGKEVSITQREATYLVQQFVAETLALHAPLAEPQQNYAFLLQPQILLPSEEISSIANKLCTPIRNDYELINYFLMRTFGKDQTGVSYLLAANAAIDRLFDEDKPATLCRNTIEEFLNQDSTLSYLSESLIETEDQYKMILSDILVENKKIKTATKRSSFLLSEAEVSMLLSRAEFVTLFEILVDPDEFETEFALYTSGAMQTAHENGTLYLEFNPHNNHVQHKIFRLNEDVHGLYFVSDFGQLIVAAYSLTAIRNLETRIRQSEINTLVIPTSKYEFKEPILYEFIQSDFDDFNEFVESLN